MTRDEARELLFSMMDSPALRRHCRTIELVMEAYAPQFGEDPDEWAITGLLHDADYDKFPDQHPNIIVEKLREMGEEKNRSCHFCSLYQMGRRIYQHPR